MSFLLTGVNCENKLHVEKNSLISVPQVFNIQPSVCLIVLYFWVAICAVLNLLGMCMVLVPVFQPVFMHFLCTSACSP